MTTKGDLCLLIERFCNREDTSLEAANAIEVALDGAFPDDERAQAVVLSLASYRPGGGEFLYDEVEIGRQLTLLLSQLPENC